MSTATSTKPAAHQSPGMAQQVVSKTAPPPEIWAKVGQLVTCDYGHPIARFNDTVKTSSEWTLFKFDWMIAPDLGPCQCGRPWRRIEKSGLQIFIEGVWR